MISQALMICGYIPIVCTAPFPAIVLSFFLLGLGIAINLAMGNVFCANLHNATAALGVMHGSYGIGGTIGPLIATAIVTTGGLIFSRYYFLILAIAFFNLFFSGWSFWHYEAETGQNLLTAIEQTASRTQNSAGTTVQQKSRVKVQIADMAKAFKSKTVILGALFIFAYQGAEVSISGCKWVFSLLRLYEALPNNDSFIKLL
jgi:fucose permease